MSVFYISCTGSPNINLIVCSVGKPIVLTAFGLVSQGNLDFFVPFNSTTPAVTSSTARKRKGLCYITSYGRLFNTVIPPLQARVRGQLVQVSPVPSFLLRTRLGSKVGDRGN